MLLCADMFAQYLKSKNFNFSTKDLENGETLIDFPYQGKLFRCFFSGENGKYLSLYLVYEKVPEDKFMDALLLCNQINTEYKWVTAFVNKNSDFVFHDDAILSLENAADESFELLARMISMSDGLKPSIMKMIYA